MPVPRSEAQQARLEAKADVQEDGARVTIVYDGGLVDAVTGSRPVTARRVVKLFAVLGGYKVDLIDGRRVQDGDTRVLVADLALAGLSVDPLRGVGDEPATTGYWLYVGEDPEKFPEGTDPPASGVRRMAIVRLENTVFVGGYPVIRVLQARG